MGILRADNIAGLGGRNAANGSVYFDGRDDVTVLQVIAADGNDDFTFGTGDFTIEFWVLQSVRNSTASLYGGRRDADNEVAPVIYLNSGVVTYYTAGSNRITGSSTLSLNSWHHIAISRASGSTKLFVNGVQEGSTYSDSNSYIAKLNRPTIGAEGRIFANNPLNGYLSNFRVVKGTALYTSNFTPPTQVLKAIEGTVLLCCQDSDNPTAEATGKEMLGQGGVYYGRRFSNLATNGGLETGDTTGWTSSSMSVTPAVSTFSHSGSYSLYCETNVNGSGVYTTVDLDTTKRYKISAYIYNVTTGSTLSKMKIGTSVAASTQYESQKASPGKWTYHEWIGIPSATTTYITFVESASGTPVVKWYVDDLRVELWYPEEDQNILGNSNFLTDATGWSFSSTPSGEYTISSNRLNIADTSRTSNAYATQQLWSSSIAEGKYRITVDYALTSGGFDIGVGNSNIWSLSGSGSVTAERVADGNNSSFRIIANQHCAGYFSNVSLFRIAEPKAPVNVPPLGVDNGTSFTDNTKFDTLSYMVPPKGTTESRNRGRGLSIGGQNNPAVSKWIDYIQIQSGGIAQDFGEATAQCNQAGGCSSQTRGLIARGYTDPASSNVIEYVELAVTSNALDFGELTSQRRRPAGLSNNTRGVWVAGSGEVPSGDNYADTIDYSTIASKGDAIDFGDNTGAQISHGGAICNSTRGVYSWGYSGGAAKSELEYLTIASTGSVATFGNLSRSHTYHFRGCSHSDSTRGVFAGGYNPVKNVIDYITIATTGQTASDFGDLSVARRSGSGTSNSVSAVFMGGYLPGLSNIIDKVTIQSTGNAADFGDLLNKTNENASCSDSHGGLS